MYAVNDAMLTLILRFVGRSERDIDFCNQEFLSRQVKAIRAYVEKFPPEERRMRAIEWIATCARQYRRAWEKETLGREIAGHRCPDCPLLASGSEEHCPIHARWMELLREYMNDEISSREYVESSLELLAQHKEDLRIRHGRLRANGG